MQLGWGVGVIQKQQGGDQGECTGQRPGFWDLAAGGTGLDHRYYTRLRWRSGWGVKYFIVVGCLADLIFRVSRCRMAAGHLRRLPISGGTRGGGMGGQMPPQLEALPPHLPPQSEWDFFFFFFFFYFFFFFFYFFFFFFTYVVSHTSHQFKINISIFCNISFYK